jgi:hypothetical protein
LSAESIKAMCEQWQAAKVAEQKATANRRQIEDDLLKALALNSREEGTQNVERDGYAIKVVYRFNRKVDDKKLLDLAAEAGISNEVLQGLFRWKPELSVAAWKAAAPSITGALMDAITTQAGRPSVSIETK